MRSERTPPKTAPKIMAIALGFFAGSGGLDADGGIPDSDWAFDTHRSFLTHSIIAGSVIETSLFALADLSSTVHGRLPSPHDPFWDKVAEMRDRIGLALNQGLSAGIGYHLMVDATIQPAPYHDLPIALQMHEHQVLMGLNAVAETLDVGNKKQLDQSPGRRAVDTVGEVMEEGKRLAASARDVAVGFWTRLWDK